MNGIVVLCVEDDIQVQMFNKPLLQDKGFVVRLAMTLAEAREEIAREMPHLIVLDIHLPDGNGLDFLRELRKSSLIPVIALTNDGDEEDIVLGLASGCDDYVPKPYTFPVLHARIEALLRRSAQLPEEITRGALTLKIMSDEVFLNGRNLMLSQKQFSLLFAFVQNENQIMSAESLYKRVWGRSMVGDDNAVKVTVSRLRKKLKGSGFVITSERGEGYRFERE